MSEVKKDYDKKRSIYSHKQGKALKFGEAWVDYYIEFGCDPDPKALYLEHVAVDGSIDKDDFDEDTKMDGKKVINARNSAYTFMKRYGIKDWVMAQKQIQAENRSVYIKEDYISMLNAIAGDPKASSGERMKAIQQVTKMLGIEGASKIEADGGLMINMDFGLEK